MKRAAAMRRAWGPQPADVLQKIFAGVPRDAVAAKVTQQPREEPEPIEMWLNGVRQVIDRVLVARARRKGIKPLGVVFADDELKSNLRRGGELMVMDLSEDRIKKAEAAIGYNSLPDVPRYDRIRLR
jgi:hypothetical protein